MCLPIDDLEHRTLAKGEHLGFQWQITHNDLGSRCGYLRLEPGHPWFGADSDDIDVQVHGGLTFARAGTACATHGPEAEWWIGFDCGQAGDLYDLDLVVDPELRAVYERINASQTRSPFPWHATVKTTEFVQAECFSLAEQARRAEIESVGERLKEVLSAAGSTQ